MKEYNITYKEVKCTNVDWDKNIFTFEYRGHTFKYQCTLYVKRENENKHIADVIDIFRDTMNRKGEDKIINILDYIEERLCGLEEAFTESEDVDEYLEGSYYALISVRDQIRNFNLEDKNAV